MLETKQKRPSRGLSNWRNIYSLKYNTMMPKLHLKSTLTCEGEIHTKGRKPNMYSIYPTMLNNNKNYNNTSVSSEVK